MARLCYNIQLVVVKDENDGKDKFRFIEHYPEDMPDDVLAHCHRLLREHLLERLTEFENGTLPVSDTAQG